MSKKTRARLEAELEACQYDLSVSRDEYNHVVEALNRSMKKASDAETEVKELKAKIITYEQLVHESGRIIGMLGNMVEHFNGKA